MKDYPIYIIVFIINIANAVFIANDKKECLSPMDYFLNKILPILISVILTGIVTYLFSARQARKSQIIKNTEEIQKLARQLGVNDKETLQSELNRKYDTIIADMGRGDKATLTAQHNDILKVIEKDFEKINTRYEKEDESYRSFTTKQKDIKETIDNFSKDYAKVIAYNQELYYENCRLREENDNIRKKNQELESQLCINSSKKDRKI